MHASWCRSLCKCMQALLKAQRPPSKGGSDIPVPDASASRPFQGMAGPFQQLAVQHHFQQLAEQPAFGQQQPGPSFGQFQQPAAPAAAFGQGTAASRIIFGQAAQPAAAFGSSAASAGNAAMPCAPAGASASSFGSTAAAAPASFGASAASRPNAFGFGGAAAAPTPAQQQQQGSFGFAGSNTAPAAGQAAAPASMQPGSLGSGPGFGQSMMAAAVPTQPLPNGQSPSEGWAPHTMPQCRTDGVTVLGKQSCKYPTSRTAALQICLFAVTGGAGSQQVSAAAGGDLAVWQAPTFTKGKIPEEPPPPSLCV